MSEDSATAQSVVRSAADVKAIAQRWNLRGDYMPAQSGQWPNLSATEALSEIRFRENARRFALDVLRATDAGVEAAEVWALILRGGAGLRKRAEAEGVA